MFRFTIRDVLWLTVVVAVACSWLIDHRRLTAPKWDVDSTFDGLPDAVWIDPGTHDPQVRIQTVSPDEN